MTSVAHVASKIFGVGLRVVAPVLLASCAGSNLPYLPPIGSVEYEHMPTTIFEACLPDEKIAFERRPVDYANLADPRLKAWGSSFVDPSLIAIAPKSVDWIEIGSAKGQFPLASLSLNEITKFSAGSEQLGLAGSTLSGQPIFQSGRGGLEASNWYLGVGLQIDAKNASGDVASVVYWFLVPKLQTGAPFTAWLSPTWMAKPGDLTDWKLIHGSPLDKSAIPPSNAPRMRFMQLDGFDYRAEDRRQIQAVYASWIQYAPERKFHEGYVAAPVTEAKIPGC